MANYILGAFGRGLCVLCKQRKRRSFTQMKIDKAQFPKSAAVPEVRSWLVDVGLIESTHCSGA